MKDSEALIIFIKNPIKGKVKTRLAKSIGDDIALDIYHKLLSKCKYIASSVDTTRYLYYSDFIDSEDGWSNTDFSKKLQAEGNIGKRMFAAFNDILKYHSKVVLIGSDIPFLSTQIIQEAFTLLNKKDLVFGPAKDGGYYLLGMKYPAESIFINIPWSTSKVLDFSLKIAKKKRLKVSLLEELSDVDYVEDLDGLDFF